MLGSRNSILFVAVAMVFLIVLGFASVGSPSSLRWTRWKLHSIQEMKSAPPGALVVQTREIGITNGRFRWVKTNWLTTPEVPSELLTEVQPGDGFSICWQDSLALALQPSDLEWSFAGFGFGHITYFRYGRPAGQGGLWQANATELCIPMWILVVLGGIPILRFIQKRQRFQKGRCQRCGYDMRATPSRCPECGTVVEKILPIGK